MLTFDFILEVSAVALGFLYLIFLIQRKRICWWFGITGSLLSIVLFYRTGLYSEAILYVYYVIIGFYGYYLWSMDTPSGQEPKILRLAFPALLVSIILGIAGGLTLGYVFSSYTDAKSPYFDAVTTSFSFVASYLEAKRFLSSWLFWILINGATIFLYTSKNLSFYTALTVIYFIFSFVGYFQWKKGMVTN